MVGASHVLYSAGSRRDRETFSTSRRYNAIGVYIGKIPQQPSWLAEIITIEPKDIRLGNLDQTVLIEFIFDIRSITLVLS